VTDSNELLTEVVEKLDQKFLERKYSDEWSNVSKELGIRTTALKLLLKRGAQAATGGFLTGSALGAAHATLTKSKNPGTYKHQLGQKSTQYGIIGGLTTGLMLTNPIVHNALVKNFEHNYIMCREFGKSKSECLQFLKNNYS
jgi:hypothetical protein